MRWLCKSQVHLRRHEGHVLHHRHGIRHPGNPMRRLRMHQHGRRRWRWRSHLHSWKALAIALRVLHIRRGPGSSTLRPLHLLLLMSMVFFPFLMLLSGLRSCSVSGTLRSSLPRRGLAAAMRWFDCTFFPFATTNVAEPRIRRPYFPAVATKPSSIGFGSHLSCNQA